MGSILPNRELARRENKYPEKLYNLWRLTLSHFSHLLSLTHTTLLIALIDSLQMDIYICTFIEIKHPKWVKLSNYHFSYLGISLKSL